MIVQVGQVLATTAAAQPAHVAPLMAADAPSQLRLIASEYMRVMEQYAMASFAPLIQNLERIVIVAQQGRLTGVTDIVTHKE